MGEGAHGSVGERRTRGHGEGERGRMGERRTRGHGDTGRGRVGEGAHGRKTDAGTRRHGDTERGRVKDLDLDLTTLSAILLRLGPGLGLRLIPINYEQEPSSGSFL
jgi:hypothetical protein